MLAGMSRIFAVLAGLMATPALAQSTVVDGRMLQGWCATDAALCQGFVTGIADTIALTPDRNLLGFFACLPPRVPPERLTEIVAQHLQEHPDWLHHAAAVLTVEALAAAYPCPNWR